MSSCENNELAIQALVDGELDGLNAARLEQHLRECADCGAAFADTTRVRALLADAAPRYSAPAALRASIEGLAERRPGADPKEQASQARGRLDAWFGGGAIGALAASLAIVFAVPQLTTVSLQDQLIAGHVRSLQAHHIVDVATSDRHVVKPWFNGRLDFAPPVVELAPQGFPLVGGRLDYIGGRPVAAIVYRRRLHSINLFVRPAFSPGSPMQISMRREGYSLVRWVAGGLEYWAVSDVEPGDLNLFAASFRQASETS